MHRLIDHFKRYRFVLSELVKKGIKLRYRRSYLGVLWTMLEPLLNMIVLYYVFGSLLGRDNTGYGGLHFMVYILSGRLIYTCFNQSTKECTRAIRMNSSLIKKVHIPKYLFPLSYIIFNYILFAISLIVLGLVSGILIAMGGQPMFSLGIFQIIVPMINLFLLSLGAGLILSTIGVFFRDMEYLWNVFMTLVFYASAIFYSIEKIQVNAPVVAKIMQLNPLFCIITNFRECLQPAGVMSWSYVLYSFLFSIVAIIFGAWVFRKNQDKFILYV
ncbi:MAG: ABC transporter permease [Acutalibacteraceae bacterium]